MGASLLLAAAKQAAEFIPPSMLGVIFGWTGNHIALPALRQGGGTVTVQVTRPQPAAASLRLCFYFSHIKLLSDSSS